MKLKYAFTGICLLAFVLLLYFRSEESQVEEPPPVEKLVKYSLAVRNTTNRTVRDSVLSIYSPVVATSFQSVVDISVSHPFETRVDDNGNQVLSIRIPEMTPFLTEIVHVKARLLMREKSQLTDRKSVKECTGPEKFIESNHPLLKAKAESLEKETPGKTAENIHAWVVANMQYSGFLKRERGALYAFQNRAGDCTEYMDLFVALCRAVDIPARCVAGYVVEGDSVLKPSDYHNWAQFYDGQAWQTADPQRDVFMQDQASYMAMTIYGTSEKAPMDFERFSISSRSLKVRMNP